MLVNAVRARLPIVRVTTTDTVHAYLMLQYALVELKATLVSPDCTLAIKPREFRVIINKQYSSIKYQELYIECAKKNATVIIVNGETHPSIFEAGELVCPPNLILKHLEGFHAKGVVIPAAEFMSAFSGLTFHTIKELCSLSMTLYKELTPQSLLILRERYYSRIEGLKKVHTQTPHYIANASINDWLAVDGIIFKKDIPELNPKGLVFYGEAGTGKTMAAKHIANELNIPLYLLDTGNILGKYLGESENKLAQVLAQVTNQAPCVLLLDEVEKLFNGTDDTGAVNRLLAQLLWWLEEKTEKVLVIMTTNDLTVIPPELVRAGRIDAKIEFPVLLLPQAKILWLKCIKEISNNKIKVACPLNKSGLTHAEVVQSAKNHIKNLIIKGVLVL